jgi:hypothetical protein
LIAETPMPRARRTSEPREPAASTFEFPESSADDEVVSSEPPKRASGVVVPSAPPQQDAVLAPSQQDTVITPPPSQQDTVITPPPSQQDTVIEPPPSLFADVRSKSAAKAVLEYMSGADRGSQVAIEASLTVGQSKHCGMSIPGDTRLSPVHCKVERTAVGFKLVDEGSANGTVVNGARIAEVDLYGGEVIMVGRTVLRFRILEGGA